MIYVTLRGRIGNQLFMYAFAKQLSEIKKEKIIINDYYVRIRGWENSLEKYNLCNVTYVHEKKWLKNNGYYIQHFALFIYKVICKFITLFKRKFVILFKVEEILQPLFNRMGIIVYQNGFGKYSVSSQKDVIIEGFFQSERYFKAVASIVKEELTINDSSQIKEMYNFDKYKDRNVVCISVKIQHNVGNNIYSVCNNGYWIEAINYIIERVESPVFFICSDDIEYVKNNLINCNKYEVIFQNKSAPVHITLAAMSKCDHFIIGNTTFGWWAQYLSKNDDKIVVAPSKWMNVEIPIDLYQDEWKIIEV